MPDDHELHGCVSEGIESDEGDFGDSDDVGQEDGLGAGAQRSGRTRRAYRISAGNYGLGFVETLKLGAEFVRGEPGLVCITSLP
ncbi:hypothetical protein BVI2075_590019 [Burkholderia vietnamiensis]|nr:hypothetical protein BVI2075_590019 [Burkholderia vietnamiensis]